MLSQNELNKIAATMRRAGEIMQAMQSDPSQRAALLPGLEQCLDGLRTLRAQRAPKGAEHMRLIEQMIAAFRGTAPPPVSTQHQTIVARLQRAAALADAADKAGPGAERDRLVTEARSELAAVRSDPAYASSPAAQNGAQSMEALLDAWVVTRGAGVPSKGGES